MAMTLKYTTGSPHFIETGHLDPAPVETDILCKVQKIIFHAWDSLKIEYGASHSEIKIDRLGNVKIIEIGARMGGDFIGSSLVQQPMGIDFVKAVIEIALGTPQIWRRIITLEWLGYILYVLKRILKFIDYL